MKRYLINRAPNSSDPIDWTAAHCLTDFCFPWEDRPVPQTEFRALWDATHLRFRFDCIDDDLVLGDGATAMDKVIGSDRVEIFLAPSLELNPYYGLEMDPRGEVLDYAARYHRQMDWDWRCDPLEIDAHIEGNRYSVEGSLPLDTLRALNVLKPGASEFLAGVYRGEFSHLPDGGVHQGWIAWVDPKSATPDFHVPE
ncbi:MAG: carbohydrate-binding family 9-like protein, partial [Verrucomicrobiae bacterium]|nr:carbohydrate-binding family 9-like protein [Verrucomicrobiae bacterium]